MLLTVFLAIVFCASMAMMLLSAVAFIQDNKFFSSAPKEARKVLVQRDKELFYGARAIGWTLFMKNKQENPIRRDETFTVSSSL